MEAFSSTGEIDEALNVLQDRIDFVGTVEQYDRSLLVMAEWAKSHGIEIDVRYRRGNISSDGRNSAELRRFVPSLTRVAEFAAGVRSDPKRMALLHEASATEKQLYDAAAIKFAALEREYGMAAMLSNIIESDEIADDRWYGRAYRNIVARPITPLLIRGLPASRSPLQP